MCARPFPSIDLAAALDDLHRRTVNYDVADSPIPGRTDGRWHLDARDTVVAVEPPGPPAPDGPWTVACRLVREYEFTDPRILRGAYRADAELLGRDMLLEGRFNGLRFYLGVRVTGIVDETRGEGADTERVWGWHYRTLEGHLEQGELSYELSKNLATGEVIFRVSGYSRRAPIPNPVIRLGWRLFGRRTQVRFYRTIGPRLRELVGSAGSDGTSPAAGSSGIVIVPTATRGHPLDRFAHRSHHPGG